MIKIKMEAIKTVLAETLLTERKEIDGKLQAIHIIKMGEAMRDIMEKAIIYVSVPDYAKTETAALLAELCGCEKREIVDIKCIGLGIYGVKVIEGGKDD